MSRLLIRVTTIESFRKYIEQSDRANFEISEQSVIDNIVGEFTGNEYTRIGTAFHSIVETGHPACKKIPASERTYRRKDPDTNKFVQYTEIIPAGREFDIDGYPVCMDIDQCKVALAYRNEHPDAFHEQRLYKDYGDGITVTGQLDMIDGLEIRDIKTKYSTPNDEDYIQSCQARFYMEMSGLTTFHYDLFVFDGYKLDRHGYDVRGLPLKRHEPITVYANGRLEQDNKELLREFVSWVKFRKLTEYLEHTKV